MSHRSPQRISLSLSENAYSVIESDMDVFFNCRNLDGFINQVIHNFKDISDASISLASQRERDKYIAWIQKANNKDMITTEEYQCIDKLVKAYTNELITRMNSFPNGIQLKPRINNENYDELEMGTSNFQEEQYYDREGKYIKALLEEYSALSFFEREEVFFKDNLTIIENAINSKNVIKIKYTNRKQEQVTLTIRPYKVVSSTLLRYHYLIALPSDRNDYQDILSLRLSRIESVRTLSRTSHITEKEKAYINGQIRKNGIQYIVSPKEKITVILTPVGMKMYKSILYLRPKALDISRCGENWELSFLCADEQIKNYFFKFGKEAVVQQPLQLKNWFQTNYASASAAYKKT